MSLPVDETLKEAIRANPSLARKLFEAWEDESETESFSIPKPVDGPICDVAIAIRPDLAEWPFRVDETQEHYHIRPELYTFDLKTKTYRFRLSDLAHAMRIVCEYYTPRELNIKTRDKMIEVTICSM